MAASRSGRSLPPGKTRCPLCRRMGGPQGRSGQVRKISPSPGFDRRTVQPVASRYTDYANDKSGSCINCYLSACAYSGSLFRIVTWLIRTVQITRCNLKCIVTKYKADTCSQNTTVLYIANDGKYLATTNFGPYSCHHQVVHLSLTRRLLMSYVYGAPILDVSRSHTTTHHSR